MWRFMFVVGDASAKMGTRLGEIDGKVRRERGKEGGRGGDARQAGRQSRTRRNQIYQYGFTGGDVGYWCSSAAAITTSTTLRTITTVPLATITTTAAAAAAPVAIPVAWCFYH